MRELAVAIHQVDQAPVVHLGQNARGSLRPFSFLLNDSRLIGRTRRRSWGTVLRFRVVVTAERRGGTSQHLIQCASTSRGERERREPDNPARDIDAATGGVILISPRGCARGRFFVRPPILFPAPTRYAFGCAQRPAASILPRVVATPTGAQRHRGRDVPHDEAPASGSLSPRRKQCCEFGLSVFALATCLSIQAFGQGATQGPESKTVKPAVMVNLNTATSAELETLPGVGAKMAARIIEYRQKKGPFKKIEELMNVQGIGEKNFLKLKPQLTVGARADVSGQQ